MKLDIGLVFKDTETVFKALAAGLTGFITTYYSSLFIFMLTNKY